MPANWSEIAEGATLNAASLNTPMGNLRTEINDLDEGSIRRNSLTNLHLPTDVVAYGHGALNPGAAHTYNNNTEPYPGWNTLAGWRPVNTDGSLGTGTLLRAQLNVSTALTGGGIYGMLVMANVEMQHLQDISGGATVSDAYLGCFALQVRLVSGTIVHIARSERYVCADAFDPGTGLTQYAVWKDVPIRCLILNADLAGGTVDDVRVVTSVADSNNPMVAATTTQLSLRRGNISAMVLRGSAL